MVRIMPDELTEEMIDAVYDLEISPIWNHDIGVDDLREIYRAFVKAAERPKNSTAESS